jgi:KDO2-lipid IV(A) lauroyltransferase
MYYIVYGIFYAFSLLPFWFFYLLSNIASFLLMHVFKYRREVILYNLSIAFPDKTDAEKRKIMKGFYRNFTDNFLETIKLISISKKELNKRFVGNYEVVNDLKGKAKRLQMLSGHFFNWEFANYAIANNINFTLITVYMPITNKIFNRLFLKIRGRFGANMISALNYRAEFLPFIHQEYGLGLVADQNPGIPNKAYWADFFGRKTSFVKGPEKGARINDAAVIVCNFYKRKRGYYGVHFKLLALDPNALPEGEITKKMISFLEESIRKDPSNYLWSHRRFRWEFNEKEHRRLVI